MFRGLWKEKRARKFKVASYRGKISFGMLKERTRRDGFTKKNSEENTEESKKQ